MSASIGVAILGGSGLGAGELLRYLVNVPQVMVATVVSTSHPGELISTAHPHLARSYPNLRFSENFSAETLRQYTHQVIFLALPHGHAARTLKELALASGLVIDLSADFRLRNEAIHRATYPDVPYEPQARTGFVYGLSELQREALKTARAISNPGCLATACILAVAPLAVHFGAEKWQDQIEGSLCFDAKTGTSGAGRTPQESMHHPFRHANFEAYKVLAHRHEPEIRQGLGLGALDGLPTMFVPHLLPTARGIFATTFAQLRESGDARALTDTFRQFYRTSPSVRIVEGTPRLHDVLGTNFCDIAIAVRGKQLVITSALDNLGKGMAGQAIQNMNIALGLDEGFGVSSPALGTI